MRVTVSCTTKFHAFYLADQLHKHGALEGLYTSFYGRFGTKRNDRGVDIPREYVHTNLIFALLYYGYNPGTHLFRSRHYGKWVAGNLKNEDIVVTWGLSALPIIEKAHELGMKVIVERGSSHAVYQRDILLEEYEKWGARTDALRRSFSPERMELELLEYELADHISIPSSFVERTFLEQGISRDKLLKVPYGVDLSEFSQLPKRDDVFRVVFAGSMDLRKGVQYLLQAFSELDLPNAELWLVGGKMPEIEPFLGKYDGKFRYFGHQPQAKLHEYYSQCSVFVICSVEEGMAMVQPQAMACGLPLICTSNTGGDDLIEDGVEGFVLPIRDVDALKGKLLFLYENRDVCYEMGQAAKCKVQQGLAWEDYGNQLMNAYKDVISEEVL